MPCPVEWAWYRTQCTLATSHNHTPTRQWVIQDSQEDRDPNTNLLYPNTLRFLIIPSFRYFPILFFASLRAPLCRLGYLITPYLHRARILSRYTTHIPRRLVSFSIPRGIHILLAFVILSFALSSYTVAGLLCRWSLAGARVFGWHFPFDSLMAWPNLFLLLLLLSIVLVGRFCTGNYHFSFLFSLILSFRFFFLILHVLLVGSP
jgi:hypothetical protein